VRHRPALPRSTARHLHLTLHPVIALHENAGSGRLSFCGCAFARRRMARERAAGAARLLRAG